MKYVGLLLAMPPAILAMAFSATSFSAGTDSEGISKHDLQAKTQFCQDCHGPSGQGTGGGYLPMPRVAGQTPEYIEKQLLAFAESMRDKNSSVGMTATHSVRPAMRSLLAAHFSRLNPDPIGDGPRDLVVAGKTIYEEGVPEANVPACSGCHGPEARGKDAIPRLAGQLDSYTKRELADWRKLRGQDPLKVGEAAAMKQVAHNLSPSQIAALAAYLSHLKT